LIIVLKPEATEEQIRHVVSRVEGLGLRAHLSRGTYRTIIGIIGDETLVQASPLEAIPGVASVIPILPPYKLASLEAHPEPSVVDVAGVKIGGGHLAMIAGPCAVEGRERMEAIAGAVKRAGANLLRGGAFKPRTSPYAYQGMGEEGLKILREVGDRYGLPIVTEVMDPRRVELVYRYTDMFQIGARNMQNFNLLNAVGKANKPVLLKRGISATLEEFLLAAEYVMAKGNTQVILCERGIRTYEDYVRNTLCLAAVPELQRVPHLPVMVDPSHGTGKSHLVDSMCRAAVAAGADGILVEVHNDPEHAATDGAQSITPRQFAEMMKSIRRIAAAVDREM
jgi:3-deoxy-7-phosphoheptulonate synthase